jgi:hypothetical protein
VVAELRTFLEFATILSVAPWILREYLIVNEVAAGMGPRHKNSEDIECQEELEK